MQGSNPTLGGNAAIMGDVGGVGSISFSTMQSQFGQGGMKDSSWADVETWFGDQNPTQILWNYMVQCLLNIGLSVPLLSSCKVGAMSVHPKQNI